MTLDFILGHLNYWLFIVLMMIGFYIVVARDLPLPRWLKDCVPYLLTIELRSAVQSGPIMRAMVQFLWGRKAVLLTLFV